MQKHNIKSSLEYSSTPTGGRAGLFHGVTTATQEKCEDKPRRKIENVLHRLKQIPLGLYSYIVSNGGMNLLRCSRTLRTSAIVSTFALILLITAIAVPIYNNISITEAATSYTSSSLSMNVTNSTASVDLGVVKDNGSFASSTNPISFNITTTNYTGYTLSLKNTKSTKTLVNSTNSSYTLDSITSSVSESAFSADTASAATNYNGKWGYKPSKYNSSSNGNYLALPTTSGSTLDTTTAANSSANTYTIGLGARASYTQAAGTYTGTYTLVAIANNVPYTINYNGNVGTSGDTVGSLPSNTTSTTSEQYITISSNTPTRTGYTFGGWCTNHTTTNPTTTLTNGSTTCPTSATTLSASGRFYINQTTNNLTTLYAIWTRKNTTYTLSYNANNGSGVPSSQSNTNNDGSYTFTLNTSTVPTRSGYNFLGYATSSSATTPTYTYTAGAGTNGAGGTFSPSTITLTQPSMSSASASTTLYAVWEELPNTIARFTYMQDVTVSACSNTTTGTTTTIKDSRDNQEYTIGKLADGNCWMLDNLALDLVANSSKLTVSNTNATDTQLAYLKGTSKGTTSDQYATSGVINWPSGTSNNYSYSVPYQQTEFKTTTGSGGYADDKYGIYYNYCAASAGTYCYGNGTSYGSPSGDASADICPSGWRMPTGKTGEYQKLYKKYNTYNTFISAFHAPLSGNFSSGSISNQGANGYFWSSTYYYTSNMYMLSVSTSGVTPADTDGRSNGYSIRCILDPKNYMQDLDSVSIAGILPSVSSTATVYDKRDGEAYAIGKLADNRYWLLENLRLGAKMRLTSADSNVASAWTTPSSLPYNSSFEYASASIDTRWANTYTSPGYSAKAGVYYNYCAATAGTYCFDYGSGNNNNANYDICPKGWRMPTGGSDGEYQALYESYSRSAGNFMNALRAPFAGERGVGDGKPLGWGEYGGFWTSSQNSNTMSDYVYYATYYGNSSMEIGGAGRSSGRSVRCVLK